MLRGLLTFSLLLSFASVPLSHAHATSVLHLTSVEQAALSQAIVEATVGGSDTMVFPDGRVYTDTVLSVSTVLSGQAPAALNVRQWGGHHAGMVHHVPGDARLAPGDKVVAMLRQVDGVWYLTAMAQSVWYVDGDGSNAEVSRDLLGLGLYQDTASGTKPLPQSPLEFAYLADLRQALTGLPVEQTP